MEIVFQTPFYCFPIVQTIYKYYFSNSFRKKKKINNSTCKCGAWTLLDFKKKKKKSSKETMNKPQQNYSSASPLGTS